MKTFLLAAMFCLLRATVLSAQTTPATRVVTFAVRSAELSDSAQSALDIVAEELGRDTTTVVRITGHTSSSEMSNPETNQELSEERAESCADYLRGKGIPDRRIDTSGMGSKKPVADNTTEQAPPQQAGGNPHYRAMTQKNQMASIAELWLYPVKSCGGIRVAAAGLADYGILYDRMFMLVDESGGHITQREFPSLAVVMPEISHNTMTLRAGGMNDVQIALEVESDEVRPISIWGHHSPAHDAGKAVAEWFSEYLHASVRLVRIGGQFRRTVDSGIITFSREVSFSDSYPLLVISRASLAALNERLPAPLPMNRFRPNIVVEHTDAFAEDSWRIIRTGDAELHFGKRCSRCVMTTIEQSTGRPDGKEPLAALSIFRRDHRGKVVFGSYFAHRQEGISLREGDEITVVEVEAI